jgi:hypothetical protein
MPMPKVSSIVAGAAFALALACHPAMAKEPVRIDASSDKKVERSFARMLRSLDTAKKMELQVAILQLNMIGVSGAAELMAKPELQKPSAVRVKDRIAGLTADEIVKLAAATSTVRIVTKGQEPGVPAELLRPLPAGDPVFPLASTRWTFTSNTNGHLREITIEMLEGGVLKGTTPGAGASTGTWEQSADEVRLTLNDGFAVDLGTWVDRDHLKGTGGNRMGTTWTWTAVRQ